MSRPDRRAQVLLVGAVAVAVVVFGAVVVLNTVVYTTSVTPQEATAASEEAATYEQVSRRDTKRLLRGFAAGRPYVNETDTDLLAANVSRYSRRLGETVATDGPATATVSLNRTASDTAPLLVQSDGGQFRADDNDKAWNLTDGGEITRFELEFTASAPAATPTPPRITVRNASAGATWRLEVYKLTGPGSLTRIRTYVNGTPATTCDVSNGARVTVNETAISTPARTCPIGLADGVPPEYSVRVTKGNKLNVDYRIGLTDAKDANFGDSPPPQPYVDDLLTEASFDFAYVSPSVTYRSSFRVDVPALVSPRLGGTDYLARQPGVTVRRNGTTVAYDARGGESAEASRSLIAPRSGALLAYDDFENPSGTPDWALTGGGANGTATGAVHTGGYAMYYTGTGVTTTGALERTATVDTTGYDAVVIEYWAQEGRVPDVGANPTAGPDLGEDEDLVLQYYDAGNGTWVTIDRLEPVEDGLAGFDRRIYVDEAAARSPSFRIRFAVSSDNTNDRWFVDDVRIRGREER